MAGKLLIRKAVIAVKQESTEGTAETLAAADADMLIYAPTHDQAVEVFRRRPARSLLSKLDGVPGKLVGSVGWRTELKGSGTVGTRPSWDTSLMACGFSGSSVSVSTTNGSVTGGSFYAGETVKDSGRNVTGRIVGALSSDALLFYHVPTSGAFGAEIVTGLTSGATTTLTQTPITNRGKEFLRDNTPISATVGYYEDGTRPTILRGSRGNVRIETGAVGEPVFLAFEFSGVLGTPIDTAILSPTYETVVPKPFLNAGPIVLGYVSPVLAGMNFDAANTVAEREDASSSAGVLSYMITEWDPTLTANPEMELVATHDFYGSLQAGTTGRSYFEVGSTAGNKITVGFPRTQYMTVAKGERTGISVSDVTMDVLGSGVNATIEDEIQIGVL